MTYLPDPIELGEMRAERWESELHVSGDNYRCVKCKSTFPIGEMTTMSADPYAPPVCEKCAGELFEKWTKEGRLGN